MKEAPTIMVNTIHNAKGDVEIVLQFSAESQSLMTTQLAKVAVDRAITKLSYEIMKNYRDEVLAQVDFTQLAQLTLNKFAERLAERISKAI